jgi:putative flippase GtrA
MQSGLSVDKLAREFFRIARFGLVGGSAALVYAVSLLSLVHLFNTGSMLSSAVAYLVAIPFSFLGQKYFTFRSKGTMWKELPAFLLLQGVNLIAAMFVTHVVVDVMGLGNFAGIVAVIIAVAIISYASMALAIFRKL